LDPRVREDDNGTLSFPACLPIEALEKLGLGIQRILFWIPHCGRQARVREDDKGDGSPIRSGMTGLCHSRENGNPVI